MPEGAYTILLVADSDDHATLIETALLRLRRFRIVSHVPDAVAAIDCLRRPSNLADRERFSLLPDIVVIDWNAPGCDHVDVLAWAQRRADRPALVIFSTPDRAVNRKLAEQLRADLYEPNISDPRTLDRFLHFAANIAEARRRHGI